MIGACPLCPSALLAKSLSALRGLCASIPTLTTGIGPGERLTLLGLSASIAAFCCRFRRQEPGTMPKGPRGEKRPADVIGAAVMVGRIATGEVEDNPTPREATFARKGGEARARRL